MKPLRLRRRLKQLGLPLLGLALVWLLLVTLPARIPNGTALRITVGAFFAWACLIETRRFQLTTLELPIDGLPFALDGLRIVQLSDLHVGALGLTRWDFNRVQRLVQRARPDLLVITGDLVARNAFNALTLRDALPPPPTLGAFAIYGNSDARYRDSVAAQLRELGVTLLVNEHRVIERAGARILIVGLDDPTEARDDLERALPGVEGPSDLTLLLTHAETPGMLHDKIAPLSRSLIVLSGHTHGGQFRLPWRARGWDAIAHTNLRNRIHSYTSRGVGYVFPMRVSCRPEVTVFILGAA